MFPVRFIEAEEVYGLYAEIWDDLPKDFYDTSHLKNISSGFTFLN